MPTVAVDPPMLVFTAATLGVVVHHTYFIHSEHMLNIPPLLTATCLLFIGTVLYQSMVLQIPILQALGFVTGLYAAFGTGLSSSILIYRIWFHRLHDFPGPFLAKLSKLYHVWCVRDLRQFKWNDGLHRKYGPIVRIGPNHLSICDPDIVELVHGARTKCSKVAAYDAEHPMTTLQQMRDKTMHERRRRSGWDQAFTAQALRSYDGRLLKYGLRLEALVRSSLGRPINIRAPIGWYSFDLMGELTFGRSFDGLSSEKTHWAIVLIRESGKVVGHTSMVAWLGHLLSRTPGSLDPRAPLIRFSEEAIEARKATPQAEPDIMSHLLEGDPFFADPVKEHKLLTGDARLAIIAGSDTTATTLTFLTYHLATHPSRQGELHKELTDHGIHDSAAVTVNGVRDLPYLNGLIKETLRLHPPVPSVLSRDTPAEGLKLGDIFIPGDVTITTPTYTIQRNPNAFVKPDEFIPERWSTRPELILHQSAFFPFSIGAFACVGRQLAYNEMRTVAAMLVLGFEICLADDEDGDDLLNNSLDVFTTDCGSLRVVFEARKRALA